MFQTLNGKGNRFWTTAAGVVVVSLWVAVLAVIPLIYYPDMPMYIRSSLIAPPLSPSPAPVNMAGAVRTRAVPVQFNPDRIYEPSTVLRERPAEQVTILPTVDLRDPTGVPGGLPGAIPRFGVPEIASPPPPAQEEAPAVSEPLVRIHVGGNVQAAKLLFQPRTAYPPLARQARVQGAVRLEAVINMDGTIENLRVLSGHPLLIRAALDSVQQWRYQPTLLNGEPVEVVTIIELSFTLGL
ncbi:MAG: energy transducer TonB [Terriglobia bacterium]